MDIDAIYLDRPTHLLVNIQSDELSEDNFVKYLFQLEFLLKMVQFLRKPLNVN